MKPLGSQTLDEFLAALAAKTPAPGGGAAACATGAIAAGLGEMVVAYSIGKKDLAQHQEQLTAARARLAKGRTTMLDLGDEDAVAYAMYSDLKRSPAPAPPLKDAQREADLAAAATACAHVPLAALAAATDLLGLLVELDAITNPHLRSDLVVSSALMLAAAEASAVNVRINLPNVSDEPERERLEMQTAVMVERARGLAGRLVGAA